jgi:hypothetical protein
VPQPAEATDAARELLSLYQAAQAEIERRLREIAADPRKRRQASKLRAISREVTQAMEGLRQESKAWLEGRLPAVYGLGGSDAALRLGEVFSWGAVDGEAVKALASEAWGNVLDATSYVDRSTKRWVRDQARRQSAAALIEGRTPEEAARIFTRSAGEVADAFGGPVGMVRYADGSLRTLEDYADTLFRTTTARAYNVGAINTMSQLGTEWCELLDGFGCGLTSHDDPVKANGLIIRVSEAALYPLSHPRCRRAISPRPDVRSVEAARAAQPFQSAEQMADQAQAERDRTTRLATRRARQPRTARAGRSPRQPRTPRQPEPVDAADLLRRQAVAVRDAVDDTHPARATHLAYTTVTYAPLNAALRSGTIANEQVAQAVRAMDDSFDTLGVTTNTDMAVRRWVDADHPITQARPGDEFIEDGYLSTTTGDLGSQFGPVRLEMQVPAGQRVQAGEDSQAELIFPRGRRLRVLSNTGRVLRLVMLP